MFNVTKQSSKLTKQAFFIGVLIMFIISFAMVKKSTENYLVILLPVISIVLATFIYCFEDKNNNKQTVICLYSLYAIFLILSLLIVMVISFMDKTNDLPPLWVIVTSQITFGFIIASLVFPHLCTKDDREALSWMMFIWFIFAILLYAISILGEIYFKSNAKIGISIHLIGIIAGIIAVLSIPVLVRSFKISLHNYENKG